MILYTKKGEQILISEKDADLSEKTWRFNNGYIRHDYTINNERYYIKLHQIVFHRMLGFVPPDWLIPDHISRDPSDNRRSNIRPSNNILNQLNRTKKLNTSSQYEGVSWAKCYSKWQALIQSNSKLIYLGRFDSELDAHKAYQLKKNKLVQTETIRLNNQINNFLMGQLG